MPKKQTFEDAAAELENIITAMETSDLTLNDAVKNYARGMKLVAFCQKELDRAQATVDKLVQEDGSIADADLLSLIGNAGKTANPADIDDIDDDFPSDEDYISFDEGADEDDE